MILKLKRTPGIFLVGFMGCGKSTVGRSLAHELGWHFLDLDEEIERASGSTIVEIFDTRGEEDYALPKQHDFAWTACTRDDQIPGECPHFSIMNEVFVETVGGDLTDQRVDFRLWRRLRPPPSAN